MDNLQTQKISQEWKYHSILLAQTKDKQIAQKWDYYVLSYNKKLYMNAQQPKPNPQTQGQSQNQIEYVTGVDTISYQILHQSQMNAEKKNQEERKSSKVILAQGDWLKSCLTPQESELIKKNKIIKFENLSIYKSIKFLYYIHEQQIKQQEINKYKESRIQLYQKLKLVSFHLIDHFLQFEPKYLHFKDCLIFQLPNQMPASMLSTGSVIASPHDNAALKYLSNLLHFKKIGNSLFLKNIGNVSKQPGQKIKQRKRKVVFDQNTNIFNFRSQYALLSNQHFLNCLVRGKKDIGSYIKIDEIYYYWIDESINQLLQNLYNQPQMRAKL